MLNLGPMRRREGRGMGQGTAQRATIAAWAQYLDRFDAPVPGSDAVARLLRTNPGVDPVNLIIETLTEQERAS